jgi:hypothetical protein
MQQQIIWMTNRSFANELLCHPCSMFFPATLTIRLYSELQCYASCSCYVRGTPKVMPPILLCWPTTLEPDAGGLAIEIEHSHRYFISFVAVRQIAAEEPSGKMAPDMKVHTRQKSATEFLHREEIAPVDIH